MQTILVIEDDHDIRVCLRQALEADGYYVFSAANGIDGLAMLQRIKPPDAIILDQNMPLMSGDAFLQIKQNDKALAPIPVIMVSAVADRSTPLGAVEFLRKPVDLNRLLEAIKRHCPQVTPKPA